MHELSLVRNVINITIDEAEKRNARKVEQVYLRIGMGRDIVVDLFSGLFDHLSKGTVAEGAELILERIPMLTRCNDCGKLYRLDVHDESTWHCPACQSENYSLYSGMEFSIDRIVAKCAANSEMAGTACAC